MKRLAPFLAALATLSATAIASAYCRTTVCNPRFTCEERPEICCVPDATGCDTNTAPLYWPTSCVSFNVHENGSSTRDISAEQLAAAVDDAFDAWLSAECTEGGVSLAVDFRGKARCGRPEFNGGDKDGNANVWMFRDSGTTTNMSAEGAYALDDSALAVTTVMFNEDTAHIYDVDVELLSSTAEFTITDTPSDVRVDLASVVTHEAGHFLGLDHSTFPGATMSRGYFPGCETANGDCVEPRTLTSDDEAAICDVYPEGRSFPGGKTCEPRGQYSPECHEEGCGCSTAGRDRAPSGLLWLFGAVGLASIWRRRRAA